MNEMEQFVLTLTNHALEEDGSIHKARVTLNPNLVQYVIASEGPVAGYTQEHADMNLRKVNAVMIEGHNVEMNLSEVDLYSLERAIGTYMLP